MAAPYHVLVVGEAPAAGLEQSAWGGFRVDRCATREAAAERLRAGPYDAMLLSAPSAADAESLALWPPLSQAVLDAAVVVVAPQPTPDLATRLLCIGVQDVWPREGASASGLARALRLAIERKALDRAARRAYATDLATGLPNHAQLLEHMTHLLALREREPAPMALIAIRVDGLAGIEARLGAESANVLRRKVAVRLRAALRASDVVAAVGRDAFVVLLAWIDAPADGERVAAKLVHALQQPFSVAGVQAAVAVSTGIGLYPQHGKQADALLRRALGQAVSLTADAALAQRIARGPAAANDESA